MNGALVSCRVGCDRCDQIDPTKCLQCSTSYYLLNSTTGICSKCSPNCLSCSSSTNCTLCSSDTILTSTSASITQCLPCVTPNCILCPSSITNCTKCRLGYNLIGSVCVAGCSRGCLQCDTNNNSICVQCRKMYGLKSDGTCVKCISGCSGTCDATNSNLCLSCAVGFELVNNKCKRCPLNCLTCLNQQCSSCASGYKLYQNTSVSPVKTICVAKCLSPCL